MNKLILLFLVSLVFSNVYSAEIGIPVQFRMKAPDGSLPNESGLTIQVQVLSPNGCILRDESFSSQSIIDGVVSVNLGNGVEGGADPGFSFPEIFDNSTPRSGLTCVDNQGQNIASGQTYNPTSIDARKLRIITTVQSQSILADFGLRASAYAYQAANAVKVSGLFSGDITGFQSNISVEKIKGIPVSGIVPTNGQVLAFDGTQYSPLTVSAPVGVTSVSAVAPLVSTGGATPQISMAQASSSGSGYLSSSDWTIFSNKLSNFSTMTSNDVTTALGYTPQNSSSSVTSVAGKTGVVTLTSSDITGLDQFVLSTTAVSGDITGTFSSLSVEQVGGKTKTEIQAAVSQVQAATTSATASTIALRDGSGNLTAQNFSAQNFSGKNLYLFDASNANSIVIRPPVSFSSYTLTLPTTTGASGQVLSTNGAGTLSWITPASNPGTVTSVTSANSYMTISNSTSTPVITLQVGSAANTVAAGDDVRITGALQTSAFNAAVASANCSNVQSAYWNSVSSQFMCQDIGTIPSAQDFTGILSGDISGTQMAVSVDKIKNVPVSATAPTTGQAMVYNGTAWAPAAGVPQLIKKTADQTFTSTTVAAVTGQSFPVVAGKTYKFKFNILYSTAATTTGIKLGMTYPAATIFSARTSATGSTADGTANEFNGTLNSSGDIVTATSTQTGINFGFVEGIITPSAAGAVQLTTGTEVNGSAVVFRAGSFVEVLELP